MLNERIEAGWISAFAEVFDLCKMRTDETIVVLGESGSRAVNVHLAELALGQLGLPYYRLTVPSPIDPAGPIVRSSGATGALTGQAAAVRALADADVVIDLTVEGLMHAPETGQILQGGARILNSSNEHPSALERLRPDGALKERVK
jgi:2,5-dihydroxypyridine 5,6-dioxygenase